jgi:uncharacterized protein (DUF305 family)
MTASMSRLQLLALIGLVLGGAGACAAQQPTRAAGTKAASTAELEALYRARTDSARLRFTPADVEFVTGMIHHHAQALVISGFAPSHGASASLRTLAARIINAQQDEIGLMQRWLEDRKQPVPQVMVMNGQVMVHGAEHAGLMPGMLTEDQMTELDRARGPQFDRLFLTYMIQHHKGALTMVDALLSHDGAAQDQAVFKLASDVHADQSTEIARMERMLAALP